MKIKWLAFIFGGASIVLLIISIVLGVALYQKYNEKPNLPKLPALQVQTTGKATGETQTTKRETGEPALAPYYYGIPLTNYSYKLLGEFPSLPENLMVYKAIPQTYDINSAKELASKFDFKNEPKITDGDFTFNEGATPSTTITKEKAIMKEESITKKEESIEGNAGAGTEPSVAPEEPEKFTGRELSVNKDGYINYQNYAVEREEVVTSEGEETKSFPPRGVESQDKAKEIAINFLKDKGLLPENYEVEMSEPYGSYFFSFYPKYKGYKLQTGIITIEIGNEGKIASLSLRKVKIEDFREYPIKNKDEALKIETIEYKIDKVELGYSPSYDQEGKEYLQPVYIFSGKDSKGNDFKFEIPAVKSEFLEQIQPVSLLKE